MAQPIYKICPQTLWREAEKAGRFDGFVHFSTGDQVRETAARHFAGMSDLLLISVDPEALGETLRWEASRGGALFPHLYGSLPMSAVRGIAPLPLAADGAHAFPAGIP
jgi:uncharacterized protein (DUF952 family)